MTKVFELKRDTRELSWKERTDIKEGCTVYCQDPDTVKRFTNLAEAMEELAKYETKICKLSGTCGVYFLIEEYYVEESVYNEDDEWIEGGDIHGFSAISISLIDDDTDEVIKAFDNWSDAEDAYNAYEGECYLSY